MVPGDPRKVEHLKELEGAGERLHLYEVSLTEEGSFDSAIDGCDCVFHTASPVVFSAADPQAEILDPAIKGTLNVLKSCKKVSSVKRVVITSSMASIVCNKNPRSLNVVIDETWFSDPAYCEETKEWYPLSKTLAEEAARKFVDENGIELVTFHPGFVIGPLLRPTLNMSSEGFVDILKGKEIFSSGVYRFVDVRDVAYAHILAFENPSANRRYCLVGKVVYSSEALKILNQLYPSLNLSNSSTENKGLSPPYQVSKERAKSLGVKFTPLELSLKDTVESLKEKNFLTF